MAGHYGQEDSYAQGPARALGVIGGHQRSWAPSHPAGPRAEPREPAAQVRGSSSAHGPAPCCRRRRGRGSPSRTPPRRVRPRRPGPRPRGCGQSSGRLLKLGANEQRRPLFLWLQLSGCCREPLFGCCGGGAAGRDAEGSVRLRGEPRRWVAEAVRGWGCRGPRVFAPGLLRRGAGGTGAAGGRFRPVKTQGRGPRGRRFLQGV